MLHHLKYIKILTHFTSNKIRITVNRAICTLRMLHNLMYINIFILFTSNKTRITVKRAIFTLRMLHHLKNIKIFTLFTSSIIRITVNKSKTSIHFNVPFREKWGRVRKELFSFQIPFFSQKIYFYITAVFQNGLICQFCKTEYHHSTRPSTDYKGKS